MWFALAQPCPARSISEPQDPKPITATPQEVIALEPGKPIEREIDGGIHAYTIQLTAGQFLRVIVDQRGVDLVVIAFGPDEKRKARVDSPTAANGPEELLLVAETSGTYRLELRSVEEIATGGRYAGRYEIKIETLRTATLEDKKVLEIFDLNNRASEQAFNAYVHQVNGDYVEALDAYQKSIPLSQATGNREQLVYTWNSMGRIHFLQGNYDRAVEYYGKSLTASEEAGNKTLVANTLHSLSLVYRNVGEFGRALDCAQRVLALNESLGHTRGLAQAHMSLGLTYSSLGDDAQALEHYRKSLALSEGLGSKELIANALDKLASLYNGEGNYTQALEYAQRALKLNEEIKNHRQTIFSAQTLWRIYLQHGDNAQALIYSQKALALSEERGDRQEIARALGGISNSNFRLGNYPQALEAAQRSAAVAGQIGNREILHGALNRLGTCYLYLNQLQNARSAFEQAVDVVESLRSSIAGNEARSDFFAAAAYPYEQDVDVLMHLHKQRPSAGYDAAAFQMSERARARSLLEALNEANADIRQGVDPALLTSERTLQQRLNAAAERQTRILSGKHTEEQTVRLQKEIDALTSEYQQVESRVRQSSPRYAALTQPVPLTISEIQRNVLDADTALLEYALGEDRSYLWVVTPKAVESFELPKRAEIETSVRRVVELLGDGKRWVTNPTIDAVYAMASDELSRMLLPPELMSELKAKRLVIVGDRALQYLPFGALPGPTSKAHIPHQRQTTADRQPLIANYEIVSLPSASALAVLRRETANRPLPTKSIAVLADPVFAATDERVRAAVAQNHQVTNGQSVNATREVSFDQSIKSRALLRAFELGSSDSNSGAPEELKIARLPFTRFEAEGIIGAAPSNQSLKATDFRANLETATSAELAQYRFVHFATHGILNSEHPELSGIVLSLVNERGQPTDGFLRLNEIYNLRLSADLVVLSACQTGLGKEIRGEGLVGLTRGFMYAGARSVVASLWKVDDRATAELMKRFYLGMLRDNLPPAAALRVAKVEMWKQKRWSAPFYWAAFELQGEWR